MGAPKDLAKVRDALVFVMLKQGKYAETRTLAEENLAVFRRAAAGFRIANALSGLGSINLLDGAFEAAHANYSEALAMFREAGDMPAVVRLAILGAALAVRERDFARAARLRGAADELKAPLGKHLLAKRDAMSSGPPAT